MIVELCRFERKLITPSIVSPCIQIRSILSRSPQSNLRCLHEIRAALPWVCMGKVPPVPDPDPRLLRSRYCKWYESVPIPTAGGCGTGTSSRICPWNFKSRTSRQLNFIHTFRRKWHCQWDMSSRTYTCRLEILQCARLHCVLPCIFGICWC